MASFFEKLRSSMGIEEEELEDQNTEETEAQEKPKKKSAKGESPSDKKEEEESGAQKIKVKSPAAKKEEPKVEITEEDAPDWFEPEGELAVDVYQTDGEIVIQSTVAGVKAEDLDVSIENDVVTISGARKNTVEEKDKNYFYQECFWGVFTRQIILPEEVDGGRADATMKDGVFTLRIPKIERQKVRKVKVRG